MNKRSKQHLAAIRISKASAKSVDELIARVRSHIKPTQEASIRERLAVMPETCRNGYLRAIIGRSPTAAIKAHCLQCVSYVRAEIRECADGACSLYPYRPFKRGQK